MSRLDSMAAAILGVGAAFILGYVLGTADHSGKDAMMEQYSAWSLQEQQDFIVAATAGTAPDTSDTARIMLDVMRCESGFRHDAIGDDGVSRGIVQFRKETFYEFAEMAKKQGVWRFGKPRWLDPQQQVFLLEWGIDNGYGRRWTCYRELVK